MERMQWAISKKTDAKLKYAFRRNVTSLFIQELRYTVEKKQNLVINVFGPTGSGKSEVVQKAAIILRKFFKEAGLDSRIHVTFGFAGTRLILPELKPGDIVIQDESTKLSGQDSRVTMDAIENILRVIRAQQVNFFFISPELTEYVATHGFLETAGQDFERRITRCILYSRFRQPLGYVLFKLHEDEEFRKWYIKEKDKNIERLKHSGGVDTMQYPPEKLQELAEKIAKKAIEMGLIVKYASHLGPAVTALNIPGSTRFITDLQHYAFSIYKKIEASLVKESIKKKEEHYDIVYDAKNDDKTFSRFRALRDVFFKYWVHEKGVNEPYARLLTSLFLWSRPIRRSNSKKQLRPIHATIENLPISEIALDWPEVTTQSLYTAKHNHAQKYASIENTLTTHELEKIGEAYAQIVLGGELQRIEHLNPPSPPFAVAVVGQFRDSFVSGLGNSGPGNGRQSGKPHDVAVVVDGFEDSVVAVNHKLFTSGKRIGKAQLSKQFGSSKHPFAVLWFTWTRPFREKFFVRIDQEWQELSWDELLEKIAERIERVARSKKQEARSKNPRNTRTREHGSDSSNNNNKATTITKQQQ